MAGYQVVGRDLPDRHYATNAVFPPLNQWHYLTPAQAKQFTASRYELMRTQEKEQQRDARHRSREAKYALFQAILDVSVDPHALWP